MKNNVKNIGNRKKPSFEVFDAIPSFSIVACELRDSSPSANVQGAAPKPMRLVSTHFLMQYWADDNMMKLTNRWRSPATLCGFISAEVDRRTQREAQLTASSHSFQGRFQNTCSSWTFLKTLQSNVWRDLLLKFEDQIQISFRLLFYNITLKSGISSRYVLLGEQCHLVLQCAVDML